MEKEREWLLRDKYNGKECEAFFADVQRLENGEMLAYLIGHVPFLNTRIFLDSHPLIPRLETEYWTEKAIQEIKDCKVSNPKVLDLCAGSGCMGVSVLANTDALVDFIEIDPLHFPTIEKNCIYNDIEKSRFRILQGDVFYAATKLQTAYDFILSNPPYIDAEANTAAQSVLANEPHLALFGGSLGMEIISRIINDAPFHLNKHGILFIEHEPEQAERIHKLGRKNGFSAITHTDQYGVSRYSRLHVSQ